MPSHHAAGPAIFTIEADGVLVPEDQFTIHVPINNWECWKYPRGPGCASGQIGMTDDDTETQSFWSNIAAGTKLFTITTTKKVSQMEIKYKGPLHAPGWLIEENGVEILKETANRGSASRPDPITYTYDFPKAAAVPEPFADSAALKTAVDNCLTAVPSGLDCCKPKSEGGGGADCGAG